MKLYHGLQKVIDYEYLFENQCGYIRAMYEQYHSERLENAFEDIDIKMALHTAS
jgi:hypothetical protein